MASRSKLLATVLLGFIILSPNAKAFDLEAVGTLNLIFPAQTSLVTTASGGSPMTVGFGVLANFDLSRAFALDIGGIYQPRAYIYDGFQTVTLTMLEIPAMIRFTPLPIVSFAAGAYFAYGLGTYSIQTNGAPTSQPASYSSTGNSQVDWGLAASVAAAIPLIPDLSLLFDLRYYFGLQNMLPSNGASSVFLRDFQLLAGLKLNI
jgi:hypothetical protein